MIDEDWFDVAFAFDDQLQHGVLCTLFESLLSRSDCTRTDLEIAAWDDTANIQQMTGGAADAAEAIRTYLDSIVDIRFEGFELSVGSGHSDYFLRDISHLNIRGSTHPFRMSADATECDGDLMERRERLVRILSQCASITEPKWGFGWYGAPPISDGERIRQLLDEPTQPLYDYNLFDQKAAEHIGYESLLNSSAWYVERLDNGGVFLCVCEPPTRCSPHESTYREVAEQLGVDTVYSDDQ